MTKTKRRWVFPMALILYAVIFLTGAFFGLRYFWDFIDAYEQSRPHIAVNAYTQQLDADFICDHAGSLIEQIDHDIQSEDDCRQAIINAIGTEFSLAKKSKECTESKLVYAVMAGKKAVGTVEFTRTGETVHGFTNWEFANDQFDLSYLLTDGPAVTVPYGFTVRVNGTALDDTYITGDPIHYPLFEEFYGDYALPYRVTYQTGKFIGEVEMTVEDFYGNAVTQEQLDDPDPYISNCTQEQIDSLNATTQNFIDHYVAFTTVAGSDTPGNYQRLLKDLVPGGELAKRMYAALDGLGWVTDRKATVDSLEIHHYIDLGGGRYLCDLTYVVTTRYWSGNNQTSTHVKMIFLQTEDGLKAESMLNS